MQRTIFDAEHDIFRDAVRRFFQEQIAPDADRWRAAGIVDREAFRKAGKQGLLMIWADEACGGLGLTDFRYEQIIIEENACFGEPGFYSTLHSRLVGPYIGELGTEEQKQRFLPSCASGDTILAIAMTEPGAGSDLASIRTRAEDKGDHFLLNGSKTYVSNGINSDVVIVVARTDPQETRGIGLFLVERGMDGFTRGKNLKKMGMKAQDTAELFFDDVKVPRTNVLGEPDQGFYYLMRFLTEERLIRACADVAEAQTAFDLTLNFVRERKAFGRPIGAFQNTRFKLADMRTEIDVAQSFCDQCVVTHNDGQLTSDTAAEAKLFCSELVGRVTDECVQLHGGAGYMDEYRISRMYTDARVARIYAGTNEIMREIIARGIGLDERKM